MAPPALTQSEVVSYIPDAGIIGYFVLEHNDQGYWYWGEPTGGSPDALSPGPFHGPYATKGEAIVAGEDWVAATAR